jgi:hypothetical protein
MPANTIEIDVEGHWNAAALMQPPFVMNRTAAARDERFLR